MTGNRVALAVTAPPRAPPSGSVVPVHLQEPMKPFVSLIAGAALLAPSPLAQADPAPGAGSQPNILVILIDDLGVDWVPVYGYAPDPPQTPNLDLMAQQGIRFTNCWSNPMCSPTRASAVTGSPRTAEPS